MQNVLPLLQKGGEVLDKVLGVGLGGLGVRAGGHGVKKLLAGHGGEQIVHPLLSPHLVGVGQAADFPAGVVLRGQVGGTVAAQYKTMIINMFSLLAL